jgi:hypothetical protein
MVGHGKSKGELNLSFCSPNCDSGLLKGFPYSCSQDEGQQVMFNPFGAATPATYTAIALSNRFDLTTPPEEGRTDCGEYRIVCERNSGATDPLKRNLIVFEAVLPNPHPHPHSLRGCRPIQDSWEVCRRQACLWRPEPFIQQSASLDHRRLGLMLGRGGWPLAAADCLSI